MNNLIRQHSKRSKKWFSLNKYWTIIGSNVFLKNNTNFIANIVLLMIFILFIF